MTGVRPAAVIRGLWGAALIVVPGRILTDVHHGPAGGVDVAVARVLGVRHLAQAAFTVTSAGRELLFLGTLADLAHAASALGLAAVDPTRRRAGLTESAIAAGFAVAGVVGMRGAEPSAAAQRLRRNVVARRVASFVPGRAWWVRSLRG